MPRKPLSRLRQPCPLSHPSHSQLALPQLIAMEITQIHTHRRNRHRSWRDGEGGALDAQRPFGSCSKRYRRSEWIHWKAADATQRLPGAPQLRRRLAERSAEGQPQRQRHRPQEDATPSLSPRLRPARSSSHTRPEATRARRTVQSHLRIASNALRLAMQPEAGAAAAAAQAHLP